MTTNSLLKKFENQFFPLKSSFFFLISHNSWHPKLVTQNKSRHPKLVTRTLATKWLTGTNIGTQNEDPEQTLALKIRTWNKPWHSKRGPKTILGTQNKDPEQTLALKMRTRNKHWHSKMLSRKNIGTQKCYMKQMLAQKCYPDQTLALKTKMNKPWHSKLLTGITTLYSTRNL